MWFTNTFVVCKTGEFYWGATHKKTILRVVEFITTAAEWHPTTFLQAEFQWKFGDCKTRSRTSVGIGEAQQHKMWRNKALMTLLFLHLQNKKKYQTFLRIHDAKVTFYLFLFCLNIPRKTLLLLKGGRPCTEHFCTFMKDCVRVIERWITGALPSFWVSKDFCTTHSDLPAKA